MFGRLSDFGHQRSLVQALGFHLAYLVTGIVFLALLGGVSGMLFGGGFDGGLMLGTVGAIIIALALSVLVLRGKGYLGHIGYLLVALVSGVGAAFGGLIVGLIFVAFLTTRPSRLSGYALPERVAL